MARYIDADKLLKDMEFVTNDVTCPLHIAATIDQTISLAETADVVEVKHGEWIIDTSIKEGTFYEVNYKILITCSICGNRHFLGTQPYCNFTQEDLKEDSYRKYRYCGQCGTKMDGQM